MRNKRLLYLASVLIALVLILAGCERKCPECPEAGAQALPYLRADKVLIRHELIDLGYMTIGDGSPSTAQTEGDESLYVEGTFEVDGAANFDGALDVDTTGAISLDADAASNFNVAGAGIDLTLEAEAGRIIVKGDEAAANAIHLDANDAVTTGIDIDVGSVSGLTIDGGLVDIGGGTGATADGDNDLLIAGDLEVDTNGDFDGDIDVDGTANLDAVDIDGTAQIDGATTVGVDGTSYDVIFYGDTAGDYAQWDQSANQLIITGTNATAALNVADGDVVVADDVRVTAQTAITVTDAGAFSPTGTYQPITAAGEVTPTINAGTAGDLLVLINTSAQTINIADTGIQMLSAAWAGGQYDSLTLWCDGTNWIEISRSDN